MDEYEFGHAGESVEMPTLDDLVNVGYDEDAAHEILEKYPEDAQRLYEVMESSNQIEAECEALIDDNESFLQGNSFFDSDISYSSSYVGDESDDTDSHDTSSAAHGKDISFGSCDCRSECNFNTGASYKYADYGYSR
jgi:hypothetical protein